MSQRHSVISLVKRFPISIVQEGPSSTIESVIKKYSDIQDDLVQVSKVIQDIGDALLEEPWHLNLMYFSSGNAYLLLRRINVILKVPIPFSFATVMVDIMLDLKFRVHEGSAPLSSFIVFLSCISVSLTYLRGVVEEVTHSS